MANSHVTLIVSILMMALFSVAIVTFAINFAEDNDSAIDLADDSDFVNINSQLQNNLSQFREDSESTSNSFFSTEAQAGDQVSQSGGQFKVGIGTSMSMATSALRSGYSKIFGSDSGFGIFITAFISILVYIAGLLAYKAWFGSSPV